MTIDGKADESAWEQASWTEYFQDIEGDKNPSPYYDTRVKMLWDDDYLYIYADMEDEHIWGNLTQRDAVIFYNNDFEVFIKPNQFEPSYAEFEVNALGTLWDLFLAKPYRLNGPVLNEWDVNNTKIGIDIRGTLNNPDDTDDGWSLEMAIPLTPVAAIDRGSKVQHGTVWRINFSRVQWQHDINGTTYTRKKDPDTGQYLPEHNWVWTPQSAIDMHRPEHWGYLYFSDGSAKVEADPYPIEYQLLFHLYREQLDWKKNHGYYTSLTSELDGPLYSYNDKIYDSSVKVTTTGFEISIDNHQGTILTINQDEKITVTSY